MNTILVTGGAGYIGSHIVVELARAGYEPVVLDNFANSKPSVLPRLRRLTGQAVPLVRGDVRDHVLLGHALREHPVAAVVHCAGLKAVGEGQSRPIAYYDANVAGATALIEAMADAGVKTFVFSSSATVYGQPDQVPVNEDAPLLPTNVYGRTKRIVEMMLQDVAASDSEWRVALLRYFNPAGAHASGEIGEAPSGTPDNLAPMVAGVASGRWPRVDVFGDDYPTHDGTGVRDYIHVVDLAEGHVAALDYLTRTRGVTTLNLGVGRGYSVLEMLAAFEHATGRQIPRRIAPRRPGDIAMCFADPTRAQALLGWRASRDLDVICADAWRWEQNAPKY